MRDRAGHVGRALAALALMLLPGCQQPLPQARPIQPASQPSAVAATLPASPSLPPSALLTLEQLQPAIDKPANSPGWDELSDRVRDMVVDAEDRIRNGDFHAAVEILERAAGFEPENARILRGLGLAHANAGNIGKALENLPNALKVAPDDLESQVWLGKLARAQRKDGLAMIAFRTALATSAAQPADPRTAEAIRNLGELLEAHGYWTAALECFEQLSQWIDKHEAQYAASRSLRDLLLRPERLLAQQGALMLWLGRYERSRELLRRAYDINKANPPTARLLLEAVIGAGELEQARALLMELADQPATRAHAASLSHVLARAYANRGQRLEALVMLADLVASRPGTDWATDRAVGALLLAGEGKLLAEQFAARIHSAEPADAFAMHYVAGTVASQTDQHQQAAELFRKSIGAKDDFMPAYEALADAYIASGRTDLLGEVLSALDRFGADNLFTSYLTGKVELARGNTVQAIEALQRARRQAHDHLPTLMLLAGAHDRAGQPGPAIRILMEALALDGQSIEIHQQLFRLHVSQHQHAEAQAVADRLIQQHPTAIEGKLMLAEMAMLTGRLEKARQSLADLQAAAPSNPQVELLAIRLDLAGGQPATMPQDQYERQVQRLSDYVRRYPRNLQAKRALAELLAGRGEHGQSAQVWGELYQATGQGDIFKAHVSALIKARQHQQALETLEKHLAERVAEQWSQLMVLSLLQKLNRADRQQELLEQWLAQAADEQTRAGYRARLLRLYEASKHHDKAHKLLDDWIASAAEPATRQALRLRKLAAFERAGQHDQAIDYVTKELGGDYVNTDNLVLQAALANMLARADLKPQEAAKGAALVNKWLAVWDSMPLELPRKYFTSPAELDRYRGISLLLLARSGKADLALARAVKWIENYPLDVIPRDVAVQILSDAGRHEHALRMIEAWIAELLGPASQPATRAAETQAENAAGDGGWSYVDRQLAGDDSNNPYGLLGVWAAATMPATGPTTEPADGWIKTWSHSKESESTQQQLVLWCRLTAIKLELLQDRHEQAVARADKYIQAGEEKLPLLRLKAAGLEGMGRREQAMEVMEQALAIDPDDGGTNNDLGYLYADLGINLDKAERMIRKALGSAPNTPAYVDSLAWVFYKRGQFAEAMMLFEALLEAADLGETDHPVVYDHIGDTCWRAGDKERAVELWRRALDRAGQEKRPSWDTRRVLQTAGHKLKAALADEPPPLAPLGAGQEPSSQPATQPSTQQSTD